MTRRAVVAALAVLMLAAAGCGGTPARPSSRIVNPEEAERLAAVLFLNHDAGGALLSAVVPMRNRGTSQIDGVVDWRHHLGAGELVTYGTDGSAIERREVIWNLRGFATPGEDGQWRVDPFDTTRNPVHLALTTSLRLANDRPENPQLLINNDASWLRKDTLGGTPVDVFSGPRVAGGEAQAAGTQRVHYWLDGEGRLRRLEIRNDDPPITLDLSAQGPQQVDIEPELRARLKAIGASPAPERQR